MKWNLRGNYNRKSWPCIIRRCLIIRQTDFSEVVARYDRNKFRQEVAFDYDFKEFKEQIINWYGLDASEAMLEKAKEKVELRFSRKITI